MWWVPRCRPDGTAEVGLGCEKSLVTGSHPAGFFPRESRVPLNVFPYRRFCEGVEADSSALAVGRDRLELLVTEDRDDSVQENPVGARGYRST